MHLSIDRRARGHPAAYHRPMPQTDRTTLREVLRNIDALILDADGVIILKGEPLPGAVEALARLDARGTPYRVVTNFSLAHRSSLAARFAARGTTIDADRLITAASAAAAHTAARFAGRPIYVIAASDAMREFEGQQTVSDDVAAVAAVSPDLGGIAAVVIGDGGDDLSYRNLGTAFRLIRGGAAFLAMHRNPWWLTPSGPTLDAGAAVAGLNTPLGSVPRSSASPRRRSSARRSKGCGTTSVDASRRPGSRWSATTRTPTFARPSAWD